MELNWISESATESAMESAMESAIVIGIWEISVGRLISSSLDTHNLWLQSPKYLISHHLIIAQANSW
jgi:hypothetical protein